MTIILRYYTECVTCES